MNETFSHSSIRDYRSMLWVAAIAALVLGVIALFAPVTAGVIVTYLLAANFLIGGVFQFVAAFRAQGWGGWLSLMVLGIASVLAGLFILAYPLLGLAGITLAVIVAMLAIGIIKMVWAFRLPRGTGRWFLVFSGILSVVVAGIIYSGFPFAALWVPGVLIGINMIFEGLSWIMYLRE